MMDETEALLHRTWIDLLVTGGFTTAIELVLESDLKINYINFNPNDVLIDLPASSATQLNSDEREWETLEKSLRLVLKGHITDQNGGPIDVENIPIDFRLKLVEPESNWKDSVRTMLQNKRLSPGNDES